MKQSIVIALGGLAAVGLFALLRPTTAGTTAQPAPRLPAAPVAAAKVSDAAPQPEATPAPAGPSAAAPATPTAPSAEAGRNGALAAPRHPASAQAFASLTKSDPFAHDPVLASRETAAPDQPGHYVRVRLVKTAHNYPLVRVEETIEKNAQTGTETVLSRTAMIGDHMMVKLQPGATEAQLEALNRKYGAKILRKMHAPGLYLVQFPDPGLDTVPAAVAAYGAEKAVAKYAEPDYLATLDATTPNDPYWGNLWGMSKISMPQAWDRFRGSGQIVVGICDSGIELTHQDLRRNIWVNPGEIAGNGIDDDTNGFVDDVYGWDFYNNDNDPSPGIYHGTHVAGTIAAMGNNATGVVGIVWSAKLMSLKIAGSDSSISVSAAVEALYYAGMMRERGVNIRLTNHSWGGPTYVQTLYDAIAYNRDVGLLVVAAAGNESNNNDASPRYPCGYNLDNILSVAATTKTDALAYYSNYGLTTVDLGAPGGNASGDDQIYSTLLGNSYGYLSGTSMATPHVTGAAALLWDLNPLATYREVRRTILAGVDPLTVLAGKSVTGGRLDVNRAILGMRPGIQHTPLLNQLNDGGHYDIDAGITPRAMLNTNRIVVLWNVTGSHSAFATNLMTRVTNDLYRYSMPTQRIGTVISYYLSAATTNGAVAVDPTNAPAALHSFAAVENMSLTVSGAPGPYGSVVPDYGLYYVPSGHLVSASATLNTPETNGQRYACTGWTGSGGVPAAGTTNALTFPIAGDATLQWNWVSQYRLDQQSSVTGLVQAAAWWNAGSTAQTLVAQDAIAQGSNSYRFAGWWLDGLRQPDATNRAVNPATGIVMNGAHRAVAQYLPATQDADGNLLPDWWEWLEFGSTNGIAGADADGDGFSNLQEYLDGTDPRNPSSYPRPPGIAHTPLQNPQRTPAPWTVTAVVTDNFHVASATLRWRRGESAWQSTVLARSGSSDLFSAAIPAPGTNGDHFTYEIEAQDDLGLAVSNSPASFDVVYPILQTTPLSAAGLLLPPGVTTNRVTTFSNRGNGALTWHLQVGFTDGMETGTNGWTRGGLTGSQWHLTTNRWHSSAHAWYMGNEAAKPPQYAPSAQAELLTPPIRLAAAPALTFWHWIASELDTDPAYPGYCYDGGIVEVSTNGTTFAMLTPIGGYPSKMHYWQPPQFPLGTPCYAGTGGWQRAAFDLSPYADSEAIFRFRFRGDDNVQYEGWYVDDLAVTSSMGTSYWFHVSATNGVVAAGGANDLTVTLDSTRVPTGNRASALRVVSDAPNAVVTNLPLSMLVRSRPRFRLNSAAQTSTNGEGYVTVDTAVYDVDNERAAIELLYSQNDGLSWTNAWIQAATPAFGAAGISNGAPPQVRSVPTWNNGAAQTNAVSVVWNSRHAPAVDLSGNTLVRARVWDGIYWSDSATSTPFMVDNQAPVSLPFLNVTSHVAGVWSTNRVLGAAWGASSDGSGVGGLRYGCAYAQTPSVGLPFALTTPALQSAHALTPDGANWWIGVTPVDARGNRGATATAGPFRIDTAPPSAAGAAVTIATSAWGSYVVGNSVTSRWNGFTDPMSGIAGYYYSLSNGSGTVNGLWTTGSTGVLAVAGAALNRTNTVYVWARDQVGLIGPAAQRSVLVLSANGDFDGDGQINSAEEIAGTSAAASESRFEFQYADDAPRSNGWDVVLYWPGVTGRTYNVLWRDDLAGGTWLPLPSLTNLPGSNGTMSFATPMDGRTSRFFRVSVSRP